MASPLDFWRHVCGICVLTALLFVLVPTAAPVHAQTPEIESLGNEVSRLFMAGHYDKATPLAERRAELVGERFGETNSDYATVLSDVGTLLSLQGRHAEAEPIITRVLVIRQKLFGQEHPDGRISFIDWETGEVESVTGFELNSRIRE